MRSLTITLPSLALLLPLAAGAARAAECPAPHSVAGVFQAVQTAGGAILTYAPTASGALPANAVKVQRDVIFSGQINGLTDGSGASPMELSVELDLVRHMASGQGYGSGEITIIARPAVPFLTAASGYKGRVDAVISGGDLLTGYFAAAGIGEMAGSSLRARFTARLTASASRTAPATTPPAPGGGNPFGTPPATNPFGVGAPTNPFAPGAPTTLPTPGAGPGLRDPLTGAPIGGSSPAATPTTTLEVKGGFGGPTTPAMLVENDLLTVLNSGEVPDLSGAVSGIFPLIQPAVGSFSLRLRGGQASYCSPAGASPLLESIETRMGAAGAGTISLRAGRSTASYRIEMVMESLRTRSIAADSNYGYAQAKVRLYGKKSALVYEGTLNGTLVPVFTRGRPVAGRFLWNGSLVLNQKSATGAVVDSLRCPFTATGILGRGGLPEIRLSTTLGRSEPFVRVVSGLANH